MAGVPVPPPEISKQQTSQNASTRGQASSTFGDFSVGSKGTIDEIGRISPLNLAIIGGIVLVGAIVIVRLK